MKTLLAALVLAAVIPFRALAQISYLECRKEAGAARSRLVPDQVIIARDTQTDTVTTSDTGGFTTGQIPVKGRVSKENARKLELLWRRKLSRDSARSSYAPVAFELSFDKKTGVGSLTRISRPYAGNLRRQRGKVRCASMSNTQVAKIEKLLRSAKVRKVLRSKDEFTTVFTCTLANKKTGLGFFAAPV